MEGRRYLLLTAAAYDVFEPFFGLIPEGRREKIEGIGEIDAFVFHGAPLDKLIESHHEPDRPPTGIERFFWRTKLLWSELRG